MTSRGLSRLLILALLAVGRGRHRPVFPREPLEILGVEENSVRRQVAAYLGGSLSMIVRRRASLAAEARLALPPFRSEANRL